MEVIYGLIPGMILLGVVMLVVLFWAVRSGQYDDLDGSANRILMDDDDPLLPNSKKKIKEDTEEKDTQDSCNHNNEADGS